MSYFIFLWAVAVGIQWGFGTSAFFVLGSLGLVLLMMFKGESIRQMQFARITSSKIGAKLLNKDSISRELMYLAKSIIVCGHTFR